MLEDLKKDATQRMQKCVSAFRDQLKKLRTGRAHTSLIEHIKVDYYGTEMPLNQVANIATEDARTLTVSPWEKAMVPVIEKAILKEKRIAQDDDRRAQDDVQKLTDKHVAEIDQAMAEKEKELMQV